MALAAVELLKAAQKNSAPASSAPVAPASSGSTTTYSATAITFNQTYSSSLYDEIYGKKDDTTYKSGYDAAFELQKNGNGLFNRSIIDGSYDVEKNVLNNEEWRVDLRKDTNNDGKIDEDDELVSTSLCDSIVDSFDSELDLYIQAQVEEIIATYGPSCGNNFRAIFGSPNSPATIELAKLGIRADAVGDHDNWQNRTYTFSLVNMEGTEDMTDEEILAHVYSDDAKILQDSEGNLGSIILPDCLVADGVAQGAEVNLSSILDQLGYECVSKADFMGNEDAYAELLVNVKAGLDNNLYKESESTINTVYGETITMAQAVCAVYEINGDAPGEWGGGRTFEQTKSMVDKLGDSLYKGGTAKKGQAINYGIENFKKDFNIDNYDTNNDGIICEQEAAEFEKDLEKAADEIKEKTKKVKKEEEQNQQQQIKETKSEEKANTQAQQDVFKDAVSEAQNAVDEALKNGEDIDVIIEKISKKYDIDKKDLLNEIDM